MYKQRNGYTNQIHHLLKSILTTHSYRHGNPLGTTMPPQRTNEILRWIEWCVFDRMLVNFCERALVRKNATMAPSDAHTPYGYVRDVIAAKLPERFGLLIEWWKISGLMKHLSTIKCRTALRKVIPLPPVMRNIARWSNTFTLVQRHDKTCGAILALDHATAAKHGIAGFLLTPEETEAARTVRKLLQDLNESGIVKIISGGRLNALEQAGCVTLKRGGDDMVVEQHVFKSFVAFAFKKTPVTHPPPQYMPPNWVPPTSNESEQFFSQAKLVLTDLRKAMDPNTVEVLMFLSNNKDWWDAFSVRAVRQSMRREI
ncbi:hypothetical protein PHMEG_00020486 [Phytophthora megakarya]|uniref:Uncharacterized protein n=1 Tax=Phytophthora megakarya TaxID=4795 RepID=A0A225VRK6_9STRA|nr:hypothetical protein PHMEG_00020486 [Phytophthora megakarya]